MTQNIEQRTELAVKKYEGAATSVDEIAHTDKDIETPVGKRKSFPKISREWDDESQRLQREWQNDSSVIREDWQTERNELSTKALGVKPWENGQSEDNINQQRRWTDNHTYLPKSVPAVMDVSGPDDNWIPYTADKSDMLNDVFGRKPVDLIAGVVLVPDVRQQYPKLNAAGKMWELDDNDQQFTVKSFSETADEHLIITLSDDSQVIAHKMEGASREWAGKVFVGKKGAQKGQAVRPKPGNETETEWYRPGVFDVSGFGDVGSDDENIVVADDAFRETREKMLASNGGKMFMPAMRYTITAPVIPDQTDTAAKFLIKGESQDSTVIETDQDIPVIVARDQMSIGRLQLKNTHADRIGRGVITNDGKQSKLSSHRDAIIEGFRFGVWHRYSIWNEYRNLILRNNTCNVRLSRHAYQQDNSNPEPSAGWNSWNDGWFHNALVFDNVYCQGGEGGVWGSMMCATFISCTTQGQKADGNNNDVLPDGFKGTGLLLDCGSDSGRKGWNNAIISHYAEDTDVAVLAIGQKFLDINGLFMQGGNQAERAQSVVRADNSFVMARGICGQDYFDDALIKAYNNSKVVLEGGIHGPLSGTNFSADATSEILPRGQCDLDKHVYRLYKAAGDNKSFTLPESLPDRSVMKLYLIGMYDGYQARFGECTITRWNGTEATEINWVSAVLTHMTVSASMAGNITVQLTGSARQEYYLVAQVIGGNSISNTSIELIGV